MTGALSSVVTTRYAPTHVDALVAAPTAWFDNPRLDAPTPLTVTDDGRVYGHLAAWGTCHTGRAGECVTPPSSPSGYAYFNAGEIPTDEGGRVTVGQITLDTGHAPLHLNAQAAAAHYDNTGAAVADVHAGEDEHGIWIAGAIRDRVKDDLERVRELMAAKLSGDWRSIKGRLELIGALAVNIPGFPIPRTQARLTASALTASDLGEHRLALVASGIVRHQWTKTDQEAYERRLRVLSARASGGLQALAELATRQENPK